MGNSVLELEQNPSVLNSNSVSTYTQPYIWQPPLGIPNKWFSLVLCIPLLDGQEKLSWLFISPPMQEESMKHF